MNAQKVRNLGSGITLILLVLAGCGVAAEPPTAGPAAQPTEGQPASSPVPETATAKKTATVVQEKIVGTLDPRQTLDPVHQRRLAGAGRPHDGGIVAVRERQVDPAQRLHGRFAGTVGLGDGLQPDEGPAGCRRGGGHGDWPLPVTSTTTS